MFHEESGSEVKNEPEPPTYRCSRKKHALGKFDAKAFFEAWGTAFDVVFREESEFKVKNGPKLLKNQDFCKIRKNLKIRNFEKFENF